MTRSVASTVAGRPAKSGAFDLAASKVAGLIELTKPRITGMVLITAMAGFLLASGGHPDGRRLLSSVIGTALVTAGAQALNQLLERKTDALMRRTENRPLPSGRIQSSEALFFGAAAAVGGVAILALAVNFLTSLLSVAALVCYLFLYTPLKRKTPLSTMVGAVPGAIPPVLGWTAARGELGPGALALFSILFFWQLPHFMAIGWMYRDDYARAGFPMIPVLDRTGGRTARHTVGWSLALLLASFLPTIFGVAGPFYLAAAVVLGFVFLCFCIGLARTRTAPAARLVLLSSVVYLPSLLVLMLLDRAAP